MDFEGGGEEDAVPQEETHIIYLESHVAVNSFTYFVCLLSIKYYAKHKTQSLSGT